MRNPLRILLLIAKHRRPSRIENMPALADAFWLRPGYEALTFFGFIITSTEREAKDMNSRLSALKRHEMIHLRQAQSTRDSWWLFYVRYLWYSLRALPYNRKFKNAAYRLNPFEIEAYENMYDEKYLDSCREHGAVGWRRYAKMSLSDRHEWVKHNT